ncbi:MAG: hypothetical protein LUH05_04535 [Candidatus Gastranaerophilales bacterium]|nr:hypothetical protein [Candidatus Gastranaerophilales bacterium]
MQNKLFSKEYNNGHLIYNILGIKLKFIDVCGKLDKIEKSLIKKEDPVNKALEKYLYAIDEREKYDYFPRGGGFSL